MTIKLIYVSLNTQVKKSELENVYIPDYLIAAHYCRSHVTRGGTSIFVKENMIQEDSKSITNLMLYCLLGNTH